MEEIKKSWRGGQELGFLYSVEIAHSVMLFRGPSKRDLKGFEPWD